MSSDTAASLYAEFGYWVIALPCLTLVFLVAWRCRKGLKGVSCFPALLVVSGLCQLPWHLSQPHSIKIVNDEALQLSLAWNLYENRTALTPVRAYSVDGSFEVLEGVVDKRALLYPFLLSLVHDVSGYRPENAFVLNGILAGLLGVIWFLIGEKLSGRRTVGFVLLVSVSSIPLLGRSATSGGFEMLNLVMLSVCLWWTLVYAQSRRTIDFLILCYLCLLGVHVRYESVLLVLLPLGLLLLGDRDQWKGRRVWHLVALLPAFFALSLLALSFLALRGQEAFSKRYHGEGLDTFSVSNLITNLPQALEFLFVPSLSSASQPVLALLGVIGFLVYLFFGIKERNGDSTAFFRGASIYGGILSVVCLVILLFFYGRLLDPLTQRLGLPFFLWFLLGLGVGLASLSRRWKHAASVVLGVSIVAWGIVSANGGRQWLAFQRSYTHAEQEMARTEFSKDHPEERFLMIDPFSTSWICRLESVISPRRFEEKREEIGFALHSGVLDSVYWWHFGPLEVADLPDALQSDEAWTRVRIFELESGRVSVYRLNRNTDDGLRLEQEFETVVARFPDQGEKEAVRKMLIKANLP